jgi:ferredoxin-type protein NapH
MQPGINTKKQIFWVKNRYWIILGCIILFLPPLSFLFQLTKDSNFCGSWCPRMFFVWRAGMTPEVFLMGFLRSYMGVTLVFLILAGTFFFGRFWCSHLCPVGGTMELGSHLIPNFLKFDYSGIPASFFRYGYLTVFFLAPALGLGSLCCNYCNFATIPRLFGAAFLEADMAYFLRTAGLINLGLVVVMGFLARGGRAYCNLLCPVGALDAVSNILGLKSVGSKSVGSKPSGAIGQASRVRRVGVKKSACNGCKACIALCPTWAIEMIDGKARVDQLSCIPCRICEDKCPQEAIGYGKIEV